jgi:DNA-binding NarL/FixJ family response regulator
VRVVVADDTLLVREGIVSLLRRAGFEVVAEASTPEELLEAVDAHAPEVAIVDVRMPPTLTAALREAAGGDVNVTIDTLWGEPALAAMRAAARHGRHVQVGQLAGLDLNLPAPTLRSVSLDVRGFSVAHAPIEVRREGYLRLTQHVARGEIVVDAQHVPLEQVATAWERQQNATGGAKQVLLPTERSARR